MKRVRIAVVGTGAIGAMMGGYLTRAGCDVTMLSVSRREQALFLQEHGLSLEGYGEDFHTAVQAAFLPDLKVEAGYDIIFLTVKSNDLERTLELVKPHAAPDGVIIPMQNGIHDPLLERFFPPEQIVTCVTFAGGAVLAPGRYRNHEGSFFIGGSEAVPKETVRLAAEIAGLVRPTAISDHIRSVQWDKLSRVCLSVPTACISGLFLGDVFLHPETQRLFAALALELFDVAGADGCPRRSVEEKSKEEWEDIWTGKKTGLERADEFRPWPRGIVDAYTSDIRKGLPLEIDYTNGTVAALGRRYGVPVPAHSALLDAVHAVERGEEQAGLPLLRRITQKTAESINRWKGTSL